MPSFVLLMGLFLALSHCSFAYIAEPRANHHSTLIGNVLMIYGGQTDINGGVSNTLISLPIDQNFDTTNPPYGPNSGVSKPGLSIYGGVIFPGGQNLNELLIYGGNNDGNVELSIYDQESNSFNNTFQFNRGVLPCDSHSGVAATTLRKAYIFGGEISHNNDTALNGLWVLDTVGFTWSMIPNNSSIPLARQAHSATLTTDGRMVIIGGQTNLNGGQTIVLMSNIDIFDTISQQWSNVNASNPPQARFSHTAVCTNTNQIIVFGGDNGLDPGFLGDLIMLDMNSSLPSWSTPNTTGTPPTARYGHSAAMVGTTMFVIYGQINDTSLDSSIYALDTTTFTWTSNYTWSDNTDNTEKLGLPIIIVIIVGSVFSVGIVIFGTYCYFKRQKKRIARQEAARNERDFFPKHPAIPSSRPSEDRQYLHRPDSFDYNNGSERPSSMSSNPIRGSFTGSLGNFPNRSHENFGMNRRSNITPYAQNPGSPAHSSWPSIPPENRLQTAGESLSQGYEPYPLANRFHQNPVSPLYLLKNSSKEEIESLDFENGADYPYQIRYK